MKKIIFILLTDLLILTQPARADLNEGQIFTRDQSCQLHYLSDKNLAGWTFEINNGTCQNQLAQGQMTLSIFNAFRQPVEQITGYFNQGYWVGNTPLKHNVLTRTADGNTQKLTFLMGKDDFLQALFIGQMSADAKKDNQYGPFILCEPLKMLIVSNNKDLFKIQSNQISLFEKAQQFAADLCPTTDNIMLFGSTKIDPKQEDIFFYADLNAQHENAHILKTPDNPTELSTSEKTTEPAPQPAPTVEENTPTDLEKIQALLLLSKTTRAPVDGHFIVQLDQINPNNTALMKEQHILIRANQLKPGRQLLFGKMSANQNANNEPLSGTFQVTRSVLCVQTACESALGEVNDI